MKTIDELFGQRAEEARVLGGAVISALAGGAAGYLVGSLFGEDSGATARILTAFGGIMGFYTGAMTGLRMQEIAEDRQRDYLVRHSNNLK